MIRKPSLNIILQRNEVLIVIGEGTTLASIKDTGVMFHDIELTICNVVF